ncbi:MAG: amidohydrolase family protein [Spirochaetota bacterium]
MKSFGKIIDVWAQPAVRQMKENLPEVASLLERSGSAGISAEDVTPDEFVQQMDEAGFDKVFLSAWHRPGKSITSNDYIADYIKKYPDRLYGMATVNLADPVAAVAELERAVKDLGMKALRIVPWLWNLAPNHKLYYPLFVKCIELDIPFCTQIGHTGPLMPSETGRLIPYLDEVMLTFPDLKVVGGHMGFPWTQETIGMMMKHKNFYIDTSAHLPKTYPQDILDYMKTWGRKKILFGTNYPQLALKKCSKQLAALELPGKIEQAFLYENAKALFKI